MIDRRSGDIRQKIGEAAMLEQLAEECVELAHAALKMARIVRKENPTPVSYKDAYESFVEETADVRLCLRVLEHSTFGEIDTEGVENTKIDRWLRRLSGGYTDAT